MEADRCEVCDAVATQTCASCGTTSYCGKEHQKQHWSSHRSQCRPYKTQVLPQKRRHLVTTRDVKQGELLFKECPVVVGPRVDSVPLCLSCYKTCEPRLCSKCCVAPICSPECETKAPHYGSECDLLARMAKVGLPEDWNLSSSLEVVLPLRCLLMKDAPGDKWRGVMELDSQSKELENTPIWNLNKDKIVKVLRDTEVITSDEEELLVLNICGILDANCFELRGPNPALMTHSSRRGERLRGVYLEAALMTHDCVGNIHLAVDDSYQMTVHASLPIPSGQPILFNYASVLESTPERFERLKEGKFLCCNCRRCSDPTELGTYMSSIICSRCHDGMVVPCNPLHKTDGLDRWFCEKCRHIYHSKLIRTTITQAWSQIEESDNSDVRAMEHLLKKFARTFPPGNVVMLEIKQNLVALYREVILREPSPSRKVMQRKVQLCLDLLNVLNVLEPGISRLRGITLYELHIPQVILANREYDSAEISSSQLLVKLMDSENTLKEAISMLLYEPANSPEGKLLKIAIDELRVLRENIQDVKILKDQQLNEDDKKGNKRKLMGKKNKK